MPLKNATIYPLPLSASQKEALILAAGKGKQAEYIRALIAADCAKRGIEWPDDLLPTGKYIRKDL